jgi:recombinational DNA repair ATPase RecF
MKILSLELTKFKPQMHGGIDSFVIDVMAPVVCIIGQNGSGKSSLLRELTVLPPVSSLFETGGRKKIAVEHNGSHYVLESSFDGKKGIHSFVKDGEELNVSNNSTTQETLCEIHFGISKLIHDLTSGNLHVCRMGPTERKALLLNCYPGSLDFLLQYHKTVVAKIKALKANIKMLKERQCELMDAKMNDREFNQMATLIEHLSNFRITIDTWVRSLSQEAESLKNHPAYRKYAGEQIVIDHGSVIAKCDEMMSRTANYRRSKPELFTNDLNSLSQVLSSQLSNKASVLDDIRTQADTLAREIGDYEGLADKNHDEEISSISKELDDIRGQISRLPIENIPILDKSVLVKMNPHVLMQVLDHIRGAGQGKILSSKEHQLLLNEKQRYVYEYESAENAMMGFKSLHQDVSKKLARHKSSGYNPKCVLPCQLKDNFNSVLTELEDEKKDFESKMETTSNKLEAAKKKISELDERTQPTSDCISSILKMENFFITHVWSSYLLNGRNLIDVLNVDPFSIYNRLTRLIANSESHYRVQELKDLEKSLSYKLEIAINAKRQTNEFVSRHLIDKKADLRKLTDKYSATKADLENLQVKLDGVTDVIGMKEDINALKDDVVAKSNFLLLRGKIRMLEAAVNDLLTYRKHADAKQLEIGSIVKEQNNLRIRLNDEIIPNLSLMEIDLAKYVELESALSPTSGISHKAMVRFTNAVVRMTNEFIRTVWTSELEICEVKETAELDGVFPVKLNRTTTIKDISIGSEGQQQIIDLAWCLALCVIKKLGSSYPIRLDEVDSALSQVHRTRLLNLFSMLLRRGDIGQIYMINHNSSLFSAFANSQIACLSQDGITVPNVVNVGVTINGKSSIN